MSFKTWKEEFYPVTAQEIVEKCATRQELILHSLQKWNGLKQENLDKHNVSIIQARVFNYIVFDNKDMEFFKTLEFTYWGELKEKLEGIDHLIIDSDSCSLCVKYEDCEDCPLYDMRDQTPCDEADENDSGPFEIWQTEKDPMIMIHTLKDCLRMPL